MVLQCNIIWVKTTYQNIIVASSSSHMCVMCIYVYISNYMCFSSKITIYGHSKLTFTTYVTGAVKVDYVSA